MKTNIIFLIISRSFLARLRNAPDKRCGANQNTHFMFNNFFFFLNMLPFILLKSILQKGRPQMTTWRMRISRYVPKAKNTLSEFIIRIAFPQQQWLHEIASILRKTYTAYLVNFYSVDRNTFLMNLTSVFFSKTLFLENVAIYM